MWQWEDNGGLREQLVEILSRAPDIHCVGAFASAEEALRQIPGRQVDVVLMDIKLPGMSGIDCVAELKRQIIRAALSTSGRDFGKQFRHRRLRSRHRSSNGLQKAQGAECKKQFAVGHVAILSKDRSKASEH